jgi:hypothetical protein
MKYLTRELYFNFATSMNLKILRSILDHSFGTLYMQMYQWLVKKEYAAPDGCCFTE